MAAVIMMDPQGFDQPRSPLPGRPRRCGRRRGSLLVVAHEAARLGVGETGGHRVPAFYGEVGLLERGLVYGYSCPDEFGIGHHGAQAMALDRVGEVTHERSPELIGRPPLPCQLRTKCCAEAGFDADRVLRKDAPRRLREIRHHVFREFGVVICFRRDGQPRQPSSVQQSDGEDRPIPGPTPDARGQLARTDLPCPTQIAGMKLKGGVLMLPRPEGIDDVMEAGIVGSRQYEVHSSQYTGPRRSTATVNDVEGPIQSGLCAITISSPGPSPTGPAELHLIAVSPQAHRTGAGTAVLAAAEELLLRDGCRTLTVHTVGPSFPSPEYGRTRHFYTTNGFVPLEEHVGLEWDGPTVIMVKSLDETSD